MISISLLALMVAVCIIDEVKPNGPCFNFEGNAHLEFEPERFNISHSARYKMSFKTTRPNGILLYARGSNDYEGIFLRRGRVHYLLYNPTPSGVEGTFGVYFRSKKRFNNDTWIEVEAFRNIRYRRGRNTLPADEIPLQCGLIIRAGGEEVHVSDGERVGVHIVKPINIGGAGRDLSSTIGGFKGQIRAVQELRNRKVFMDPSRNNGVARCFYREPQ